MKDGIITETVKKIISDGDMDKLKNTHVTPRQIHYIIKNDTDIYTEDGKLLLSYRKKVLPENHLKSYYSSLKDFTIKHPSSNRGSASGSKYKDIYKNHKVYSSIIGYFDKWSPTQKKKLRELDIKLSSIPEVRETFFTASESELYKNAVPLIENINRLYKKLIPKQFKKQNDKAKETKFRISNTSFTTVTTNINYKTTIHRDKGDDEEGFGNLVVIEDGNYTGGETCFPQYGIGVDVREGDILFMDVHQWHGNLPMNMEGDGKRMSIVCYLRKKVWERTKDLSEEEYKRIFKIMRSLNSNVEKKNRRKTLRNKLQSRRKTMRN